MLPICNVLMKMGKLFVLHHPTSVVRASVFNEVGSFDGDATVAADTDFLLRSYRKYRIANLPLVLYGYRIRPDSLTGALQTGFSSDVRTLYTERMLSREHQRNKAEDSSIFQALPYDRYFKISEIRWRFSVT
jgi:hypothetical protein